MRFKHKKLFISGAAVAAAGALGVGALLQTVLSVQASSDMMPGIEQIVSENTEDEPFRILELVNNSEDAEIGYYISGQEPSLKLYQYQYTDSSGNSQTVHFSSVQEALSKLPTAQRSEFMQNIKSDGSSTGIKNIAAVTGDDGPLSYSPYTEKYFLDSGDTGWTKVDLTDFNGNTRTDTVSVNGSYQENSAGTGNYTKAEQQYYPIRNDVQSDKEQTEKYRENIQNFYPSESSDSRGAYYLEFAEVENDKVNNALKKDNGKAEILPEYEYTNARYGYYENVYTDLTKEIVDNIDAANNGNAEYQFPGENPVGFKKDDSVLIQDNTEEAVKSTIEESNSFTSGETAAGTEDTTDSSSQDEFSGDSGSDNGSTDSDSAFQSDEEDSFDGSDSDTFDSDISLEQQSYEEPVESSGTDAFSDDFSDQAADSEDSSADVDTEVQNQEDTDSFTEDQTDIDSAEDAGDGTDQTDTQRKISGIIQNKDTAGTQANPYVYLGENIAEYPYYKYELIGDMEYLEKKAEKTEAKLQNDQNNQITLEDGDILLDNDQYWYYKDDNGTLKKYPISVVTGRQPVAFNELQKIPEYFDYNYYYRVEKVYFCCKSVDNSQEDPSACAYFGWYYPSYPVNEDAYLPVTDGKAATHYISAASYSLTPGKGNYDFVPGGDNSCQVQVNSFYYQGGYTNNDWFKKYVFHLSPKASEEEEDGEFENFGIEVDTKSAEDVTSAVYATVSGEDISGQSISVDDVAVGEGEVSGDENIQNNGTDAEVDFSSEYQEPDTQDVNESVDSVDISENIDEESQKESGEVAFDETDVEVSDETDSDVEVQNEEEPAVDVGDGETTNAITDVISGYDLVYVNGNLSQDVAEALAEAVTTNEIPCIINGSRITDDSQIVNAFSAVIKDTDDDTDGHYVDKYIYFFKNMLAGTEADYNLVNKQFHENFNSHTDSEEDDIYGESDPVAGFEEIIKYINSENRYRKLETDRSGLNDGESDETGISQLSREISQARVLEYIINYKYKRNVLTKDKINVLEIMPDDNCSQLTKDDVISWLGAKKSRVKDVTACCYYNAADGTDDNPSNVIDNDASTIWHSDWSSNSTHKLTDKSTDRHHITLHFRNPEDIKGFVYQARWYKTNNNWDKNGVLSRYTVVCENKNGKEIYRKEKQSVGEEFTSSETRSIKFGETVENVSYMTIYFEETLGTGTPQYDNASCASLDAIYADDDTTSVSVDVTINSMTASEFVGHIDDIASEYDMIYISDRKNSNNNDLITGSGNLRYSHVGAGRKVTTGTKELHKLLGQLDNEYDQNWIGNKGIRRFAPFNTYGSEGGGYFRGSGNDMTSEECEELLEFVKSGYPVVLGNSLLNSDRTVDTDEVDNSSYYYEFLSQAISYDNVVTKSELDSGQKDMNFYFNLTKPVIQFDENGGRPKEPTRIGEAETDENGYIDGELKYTFTIENDSEVTPMSTTYDCELYLDLNFDGNFSEKESQKNYMVIQDENGNVLSQKDYGNGDMRYELKSGQKYTVTRKIPADYFKVITWKLKLTNNRNAYIHTSEIGYAKQKNTGTPQQINVLQLIPERCTWNLKTDTNFQKWLKQIEDFNINITTKTVNEIKTYTRADMDSLLSDKQMLVIGFADVYQDISNDNGQVNAILDFVKSGKSIIFSHDTTSYVNYDKDKMYEKIATTEYGVDENTNRYYDKWLFETAKNPTWGLSLNTILRSVVGMDRYGITSDETIGNQTVSQLLKKGQGLDSSSVSFSDLISVSGDIAYSTGSGRSSSYAQPQAYTNHLVSGIKLGENGNRSKVTSAAKINDGAITQYPFRIGNSISVAETHGQYYQLALEQDKDINGMSDGKTDVVVWYCLRDGIYDYSPNDVRNNYYFYSKGNVIYTGAGHSTVSGEEEIKLFINAMVAAANVTAVEPEIHFVKSRNPAAEIETSRYYMTDQSSWTSGENNTLEKDMTYYINVRDYNMISADLSQEDLDNQKMTVEFFIEDEKGAIADGCPSDGKKVRNITSEIGTLTGYGNIGSVNVSGGKFYLSQNSAYELKIPNIEKYLRSQTGNNGYKDSCKVYAKVTSTVSLYGKTYASTSWASIDLKQRQLFEMD
ncbi:DUF5057 domain-containing protein [Blautia obeum]|uniref:DUF5057 domain-containing protein n=1 Tax=Blautia obeum TaxID=40520 RepID=UPI000E4E1479|nr:DUF5057 domain-containing protein [Blautia obeum]RGS17776.1 DUF5057 domain-containing protein [Blautia obeum]